MVAVTGGVNAVSGAVITVSWGSDPALVVTGTVPSVIAVAGCHSPSRRACPARHTGVACSRNASLRDRSYDRSLRDTRRYARPSRYPLHRCRSRRWSHASCSRVFVPNRPKAETAPLPGKGCHAATSARIVPGGSQAIG